MPPGFHLRHSGAEPQLGTMDVEGAISCFYLLMVTLTVTQKEGHWLSFPVAQCLLNTHYVPAPLLGTGDGDEKMVPLLGCLTVEPRSQVFECVSAPHCKWETCFS